jgi:hypothetical protein
LLLIFSLKTNEWIDIERAAKFVMHHTNKLIASGVWIYMWFNGAA